MFTNSYFSENALYYESPKTEWLVINGWESLPIPRLDPQKNGRRKIAEAISDLKMQTAPE